jgi:hypothetical protein
VRRGLASLSVLLASGGFIASSALAVAVSVLNAVGVFSCSVGAVLHSSWASALEAIKPPEASKTDRDARPRRTTVFFSQFILGNPIERH